MEKVAVQQRLLESIQSLADSENTSVSSLIQTHKHSCNVKFAISDVKAAVSAVGKVGTAIILPSSQVHQTPYAAIAVSSDNASTASTPGSVRKRKLIKGLVGDEQDFESKRCRIDNNRDMVR